METQIAPALDATAFPENRYPKFTLFGHCLEVLKLGSKLNVEQTAKTLLL
jgi:hypothetical protein